MSFFSSFRKPCLLIDEKPWRIIDPHPKVHWCLIFMSSISQRVPEERSTGKEESLCITILPSVQTLKRERVYFSPVMFCVSPYMSWLLKHLKDIENKHIKLLHYCYHYKPLSPFAISKFLNFFYKSQDSIHFRLCRPKIVILSLTSQTNIMKATV